MWARKLLADSLRARAPSIGEVLAVAPDYATAALSNITGSLLFVAWLRETGRLSRRFTTDAGEGDKAGHLEEQQALGSGGAAGDTNNSPAEQLRRLSSAASTSRRAPHERLLGRWTRAPDPPLLTSWLHWAESPEEARQRRPIRHAPEPPPSALTHRPWTLLHAFLADLWGITPTN